MEQEGTGNQWEVMMGQVQAQAQAMMAQAQAHEAHEAHEQMQAHAQLHDQILVLVGSLSDIHSGAEPVRVPPWYPPHRVFVAAALVRVVAHIRLSTPGLAWALNYPINKALSTATKAGCQSLCGACDTCKHGHAAQDYIAAVIGPAVDMPLSRVLFDHRDVLGWMAHERTGYHLGMQRTDGVAAFTFHSSHLRALLQGPGRLPPHILCFMPHGTARGGTMEWAPEAPREPRKCRYGAKCWRKRKGCAFSH